MRLLLSFRFALLFLLISQIILTAPAYSQAFSNSTELGVFYATTRANEGSEAKPLYGSARHLDLGQGPLSSIEYGVAPFHRGNFDSIAESKSWSQLRLDMGKRDEYWTAARVGQPSKLSDSDFYNRVKNFHGLICIYVHGYDITFDQSARELAELADEYEKRSGQPMLPILFSWPSTGSKVDYTGDEASLEWSEAPFRDFVNKLSSEKNADSSIDLLAHSMGSRLAFWYAMAEAPILNSNSGARPPFRNVFLSCADIDYHTAEQRKGDLEKCCEKNVFVLTNDDDGPLLTSQALHAQTRLGRPADGGIAVRQIASAGTGINRIPRSTSDLRNMVSNANSAELLNQVSSLFAASQGGGSKGNSMAQFALNTFLSKPSSGNLLAGQGAASNGSDTDEVRVWLAANPQLSREWGTRSKLIDDTGLVTVNMGHRIAWPLLAGLMLNEPASPPFVANLVHKRPDSLLLREMGGTPTYLYRYYKIDLERLSR